MPGRLFLGTSGFAYQEWKGDFYPPEVKPSAMLRYYGTRFPSVEINYTFTRTCTPGMVERWMEDTPDDFVFSLKAHRSITFFKRLGPEAAEPLADFVRSLEPLRSRLGAVLMQCPHNMKPDLPRLEGFLAMLPSGMRVAFDFRHPGWRDDAVYALLAAHGCAWCVADDDTFDAPLLRTTSSFAYLRLRKVEYGDDSLDGWAKQISEVLDEGSDVYCYFKHEDEARGARFALRLLEVVSGSRPAREAPA
jgi:uncharacterized protein YecE (DUF72 family)